ncbi:hypothetical protein GCM10007416_35410 [Kroppenstedtia guangzhouensis]|uniref:Transposase n=1 Tax=Kroppenstedtia guangzhouensis TaxID=1274356 RepID=A0ABQ1H6P0_9BACL|nr:hypothetical protein [Kroppenstedtia guangzhouensis]GGA59217.1 hypothetical protein GCM10007416_35410 [Kroppenstedtia guangzhouensis]
MKIERVYLLSEEESKQLVYDSLARYINSSFNKTIVRRRKKEEPSGEVRNLRKSIQRQAG